ncbi:MAG: DUF3363 domain-containing protein [Nitrospirae bacterium]|nr:DUF3363 domain-containing protein [Nitrospirota bacterium]
MKARVVKMNAKGVKNLREHLAYIQRDGVDQDGGKPKAFDHDHDELPSKHIAEFADNCSGDRHTFRFILSPENGTSLNMKEYVREVMTQAETDLKTELKWTAVVHYNTDNTHAHILIRGKDDAGNDLVISPDYISHGFRNRAAEIATQNLGLRTEHEIKQGIARDAIKNRLTPLDREILWACDVNGFYAVPPITADPDQNFKRAVHIRRLQHLESLGLAEERLSGFWHIYNGAEKVLKEMGERNDIIKTMHKRMKGLDRMPECIVHRTDDPHISKTEINGMVLTKGLENELYDSKFIIVQADDGKAHYFPMSYFSERPGFEVEEGSLVTIKGKEYQPTFASDKNIVRFATEGFPGNDGKRFGGQGIYDPAAHLEYVSGKLPEGVDPSRYVDQHIMRVEKFVSQKLATRLEDGTYRIEPGTAQKIAEIETAAQKKGPRRHYEIDAVSIAPLDRQIHSSGPTYLDKLIAERGYTEEAQRAILTPVQKKTRDALLRRVEELKKRGLLRIIPGENGEPNKYLFIKGAIEKMEEEFKAALYKRLESKYGKPVDLKEGESFKGALGAVERHPEGPYAIIHDKVNNKFTAIEMKGGMSKMTGTDRLIKITKDRERRFLAPPKYTMKVDQPKRIERKQDRGRDL